MFHEHVKRQLSAYLHGELPPPLRQQVQIHLSECADCQRELERAKHVIRLISNLETVSAPSGLWEMVKGRLHNEKPQGWGWRRYGYAVCGFLLLAFLAIGGKKILDRPNSSVGWEVDSLTGAPIIGTAKIKGTRQLGVGDWLETDTNSTAKIRVANIGHLDIAPNSRLQLVESSHSEHRINLEKGRLEALILAPPRLFVVDTPSATAIDLGCAYTLDVDDEGNGLLHVKSGWVSLALAQYEAVIPAGATCVSKKGVGIGTPYYDDSSESLRKALRYLDFEKPGHNDSNLAILLSEARVRDAITLWHLLSRIDKYPISTREQIFDRLNQLVPIPENISRHEILSGNREQLSLWWKEKIR